MSIEAVDYLFVGAHADDVELSCSATLATMVRRGSRAAIVDLTRGEMGTRGTPAERKREAKASARILGAAYRHQLDFGDGGLRTGRQEELELIELIRQARPAVVIAPYPDERHPDHVRAGRLVTDAAFYAGLRALATASPAHRPQVTAYYLQNYMITPSFVVDVTAAWKTKMRAIAQFKSQFFNARDKRPQTFISRPEFLEMIEARGRHFGALIACGIA
jgi:bacillithiol biosynthesis deacetylase BshB1